jgi:hypothetical protein
VTAESIEGFIENQAFLRSYDLTPRPPPSPFPVTELFLFLSLIVPPVDLADGRGGQGVGEEPNVRTKCLETTKKDVFKK